MKSRTPKNYQGIDNPVKKIGDLLPHILSEIGSKLSDPKEEIFRFWFEILGEKMGPLTEPFSFIEGVLTVKVKSSTLYSILCQHEKPRLLRRLQEKFSIKNIVFKVG